MSEPERKGGSEPTEAKLLTLSEVSKQTKISMPTLQRYKKLYQDRIPSQGKGRSQRYPREALPVFEQLKVENVGRRGRPRKQQADKAAAKPPKRKAAAPKKGATAKVVKKAAARPKAVKKVAAKPQSVKKVAAKPQAVKKVAAKRAAAKPQAAKMPAPKPRAAKRPSGLLTLTEISKKTGISYPTLVRYVKLAADRLPHEGVGRARRFYQEAVEVFHRMRQESSRGRKAGAGGGRRAAQGASGAAATDGALGKRLQALERSQARLEKTIAGLVKALKRPLLR